MVNENLINLTNNKKPVELVQEVNNEIPSYEEFMKSYESDDKVNYADLNSGDVGEVKGYGPCTSTNCTHSRSELQEQLREAQRELEDLRSQLSNTRNNVSISIIEQNIIIIQQKISIINIRLGSRPSTGCIRFVRFVLDTETVRVRFIADYHDYLDVGGDTVNWEQHSWWTRRLNGRYSWYRNSYVDTYKGEITLKNIRQLKEFLRRLNNGDISIGVEIGDRDVQKANLKAKLRELIDKYERGEDITGTYTIY